MIATTKVPEMSLEFARSGHWWTVARKNFQTISTILQVLSGNKINYIIPYIIFYCIKVMRQLGSFMENCLMRETTWWRTQTYILYIQLPYDHDHEGPLNIYINVKTYRFHLIIPSTMTFLKFFCSIVIIQYGNSIILTKCVFL